MNKFLLVFTLILMFISFKAYATDCNCNNIERDSLKIQLYGEFKREYIWIQYDSITLFKGYVNGKIVKNFLVDIKNVKNNDFLEIYVLRKPLLGLRYRLTDFATVLYGNIEILVIYRDIFRKRRYPVIPMWLDRPPGIFYLED